MRKFFVIAALVAVVALGGAVIQTAKNDKTLIKIPEITLPTPTPGPFVELTIPYPRERPYESNLAGLEEVSESPAYQLTRLTV